MTRKRASLVCDPARDWLWLAAPRDGAAFCASTGKADATLYNQPLKSRGVQTATATVIQHDERYRRARGIRSGRPGVGRLEKGQIHIGERGSSRLDAYSARDSSSTPTRIPCTRSPTRWPHTPRAWPCEERRPVAAQGARVTVEAETRRTTSSSSSASNRTGSRPGSRRTATGFRRERARPAAYIQQEIILRRQGEPQGAEEDGLTYLRPLQFASSRRSSCCRFASAFS